MTLGEFVIQTNRNGSLADFYLDGEKLAHVCGYQVSSSVGELPTVTVKFRATAEILREKPEPKSDAEAMTNLFVDDLAQRRANTRAHGND